MPRNLELARLTLSGSLVGIALSGLLVWNFGWDRGATDLVGALAGGALTAALLKYSEAPLGASAVVSPSLGPT
jgi:hypothetical protein